MDVSTKRQRIAELGKQFVQRSFTFLHHQLDLEWFAEAYRCLHAKSAPGADGVTVEEYGKNLRSNLESLRERVLGGTYRAPAVRRVRIPKGTGGNETRPGGPANKRCYPLADSVRSGQQSPQAKRPRTWIDSPGRCIPMRPKTLVRLPMLLARRFGRRSYLQRVQSSQRPILHQVRPERG